MNTDQIKQHVRRLVQDGGYFIKWQHIKQRGHCVEEYEIKTVLLHGRHVPDRDDRGCDNSIRGLRHERRIPYRHTGRTCKRAADD